MSNWSEQIKACFPKTNPYKAVVIYVHFRWDVEITVLLVFGSSTSLALSRTVLHPRFLVKGRARCGVSENVRSNVGEQQTMCSVHCPNFDTLCTRLLFLVLVAFWILPGCPTVCLCNCSCLIAAMPCVLEVPLSFRFADFDVTARSA